jgi:hypothetical protein
MMMWLAGAAAPSPVTPTPSPAVEINEVTATPGLVGFLVTFAMVVVAIFIFRMMGRSLRRATRNAEAAGMDVVQPKRLGVHSGPETPVGETDAPASAAPESAVPESAVPNSDVLNPPPSTEEHR